MARLAKAAQILVGLLLTASFAVRMNESCKAQMSKSESDAPAMPNVIIVRPVGYVPRSQTEDSEQGKQLFENLNCMSCHSLHNVGGDLAPRLDGIGGHRSEQFLLDQLSNNSTAKIDYFCLPGSHYANTLPHSRYSPPVAAKLVSYLLTLPEPQGGFVVVPHVAALPAETPPVNVKFQPEPKSESSAEGQKLYDRFGCVACHAIGEVGGWLGPRLDGVGGRHSRLYIASQITNAQAHARENASSADEQPSRMPHFEATPQEIQKITDFLMTIPNLNNK